MKAKCSHCNNGRVSPYDYYGQVIGSGVCGWCDGKVWIPFERFKRQVERGRADLPKLDIPEMSEEDRAILKKWVDSLGSEEQEESNQ